MDNYRKIGFFTSWNLEKYNDTYFLSNMHYAYIEHLCNNYEKIVLISSCKIIDHKPKTCSLETLNNLIVIELPYIPTYLSSIFKFKEYYVALKKGIKMVDVMYCRTPDPFSWLPRFLTRKTPIIMDFVGDTIDCTKNNENWSALKKTIMIIGYIPDYLLTLLAAKNSKVFTAGAKLSKNLSKYKISSTPLVPSLIKIKEIPKHLRTIDVSNIINIIYVGYIRNAKGITTIMDLCSMLKKNNINFHFDIIGIGEMYQELENFINHNQLKTNITLHGHIDDRLTINNLLYNSDLFFFPSLSEGAPRVVIEAMAQGTPVLSTPVGALPYTFKDNETIRFFDYNNVEQAYGIIYEYLNDTSSFIKQRDLAFQQVKENYTIDTFFKNIFYYEA